MSAPFSHQVLANLLANAVKFTAEGEVVVRVVLEHATPSLPSEVGGSSPTVHPQPVRVENPASCGFRPASPSSTSHAPRDRDRGSCSSLTLSSNRSRNTSRSDKSPSHDLIRFSVQDSGIGISEVQASKLFQCFKQGSETMSRRYGGAGLGLAICRRLTELMHGEVWVESELGRGSTFHFTMEAERLDQQAQSLADDHKTMLVTSWPGSNFYEPSSFSRTSSLAQIEPHPDVSGQSIAHTSSVSNALSDGHGVCAPQSIAHTSSASNALSDRIGVCAPQVLELDPLQSSIHAIRPAALELDPSGPAGNSVPDATSNAAEPECVPPRDLALRQEASPSIPPPKAASRVGRPPEEPFCLEGRRVLVDIAHKPTALQIVQSCRHLGMVAEFGDSRASLPSGAPFEMAVVGVEHAAEAIRASWKGRPLVVAGDRNALPRNLHPLVVFLPLPAKHSRLYVALVKSSVVLQWPTRGAKLTEDVTSQRLFSVRASSLFSRALVPCFSFPP